MNAVTMPLDCLPAYPLSLAIDQFCDAMRAAGLEPPDVIEPGKLHRFPGVGKRNGNTAGWCKLFDDGLGGCFGDWSSGLSAHWQVKRDKLFPPVEREAFKRHVAEAQAQAEAERKTRQVEAAAKAAAIWNATAPAPDNHAYLLRKGIKSHGVRMLSGALVISLRDSNGETHSLQFIALDGEKRFLTGGRVAGCYFSIGSMQGATALCIAEGFATGATIHQATGHPVAVAFNAGNLKAVAQAMRERFPALPLIVCADDDANTEGNPGLTKAREAAQAVGGFLAAPDFGASQPDGATDFNDLHRHAGIEVVHACIEQAATLGAAGEDAQAEQKPMPTMNALFEDEAKKLAALSPIEYDRIREAKAKALRVRVAVLDKEVKKHRPTQDTAAELFNDPEPWPEAVNGPELFSEVHSAVSRYVYLSGKAGDAITLWIMHAHAFRAFQHSPRLNPYSPEKGCGKTTLLDVMQALTPKALRTENVTTAVLFRLIDAQAPTLLVDEYDTFLKDNEELRGALNAGHRRGGRHLRCEGDDNQVKAFSTFAPVALAGIRELPGTLSDRSIKIRMQRAKPNEIKERFDTRSAATLIPLKRKAARWAQDHLAQLEQADPGMGSLYNRVADNWRPLFAIAALVGCDWPERARQAAAELNQDTDAQGTAVLLLEDLKELLSERDKLTSAEICEHLAGLKERPWPEWNHGKPINPQQVSKLLRPFGIKPAVIRVGDKTPRGYERSQFVEAFDRYLLPATPQQSGEKRGFRDFEGATPINDVAGQKSQESLKNWECCTVAGENPGTGWEEVL